MLSMQLQMLGAKMNIISGKLLMIRFNRIKLTTVDAVKAIIENDQREIDSHYDTMYAENTIKNEWENLTGIKKEIDDLISENMHLFTEANSKLKQAGLQEVDPSELTLPESTLQDLAESSHSENIYDKMQEYNDLLNEFLNKMVKLCGETGMRLVKIHS